MKEEEEEEKKKKDEPRPFSALPRTARYFILRATNTKKGDERPLRTPG